LPPLPFCKGLLKLSKFKQFTLFFSKQPHLLKASVVSCGLKIMIDKNNIYQAAKKPEISLNMEHQMGTSS